MSWTLTDPNPHLSRYLVGEFVTLLRLAHADPQRWECRREQASLEPVPASTSSYRVMGAGKSSVHQLEGVQFVASRVCSAVELRCSGQLVAFPAHLIAVERNAYLDAVNQLSDELRLAYQDLILMSFPLLRVKSDGYICRSDRVNKLQEGCAEQLFKIAITMPLAECVA